MAEPPASAEVAEQAKRQGFRVAAAIDFGTHSTGYAWAPVDAANDSPATRLIQFRTQWPDQPVSSAKTLTAVLFDIDGQVAAWGHTARSMHVIPGRMLRGPYFYGFKLAFRLGPRNGPVPLPTPDDAADVAGRYLREIVQEAIRQITSSGYREHEIRWCLTVPAIWDDHAMSLTRKVAELAGLPTDNERLRLVYEPEAAAVYCRIRGAHLAGTDHEPNSPTLSQNSRYLVVDCGGGTADITAYKTDRSGQLDQIGRMSGGAFGSENLNLAFLTDVVADRLGGPDKVVDLGRAHPQALLQLTYAWEERKHTLAASVTKDGSVKIDEAVSIPLDWSVYHALKHIVPDLDERLRRRGAEGHIVVQPSELTTLFDGVINKILQEVDKQLTAVAQECGPPEGAETVLLVGGFSQSRYLQLRLRQHLNKRAEVLVPAAGAEAVLAGAVHLCYNPELIRIRRSRYTYGYEVSKPFEPDVDPESLKYVSGYEDTLCSGRFSRIVAINQAVSADHEVDHTVYPTAPDHRSVVVRLVTSTDLDPRYVDGSTARGELVVDISSTVGQPANKRGVDLTFRFSGAEITVSAIDRASGKKRTTAIDFERANGITLPDVTPPKPREPAVHRITPIEPAGPSKQRPALRHRQPVELTPEAPKTKWWRRHHD